MLRDAVKFGVYIKATKIKQIVVHFCANMKLANVLLLCVAVFVEAGAQSQTCPYGTEGICLANSNRQCPQTSVCRPVEGGVFGVCCRRQTPTPVEGGAQSLICPNGTEGVCLDTTNRQCPLTSECRPVEGGASGVCCRRRTPTPIEGGAQSQPCGYGTEGVCLDNTNRQCPLTSVCRPIEGVDFGVCCRRRTPTPVEGGAQSQICPYGTEGVCLDNTNRQCPQTSVCRPVEGGAFGGSDGVCCRRWTPPPVEGGAQSQICPYGTEGVCLANSNRQCPLTSECRPLEGGIFGVCCRRRTPTPVEGGGQSQICPYGTEGVCLDTTNRQCPLTSECRPVEGGASGVCCRRRTPTPIEGGTQTLGGGDTPSPGGGGTLGSGGALGGGGTLGGGGAGGGGTPG